MFGQLILQYMSFWTGFSLQEIAGGSSDGWRNFRYNTKNILSKFNKFISESPCLFLAKRTIFYCEPIFLSQMLQFL